MTPKRFTLTYEIVTEDSSHHGDFAYNGFVTRDGGTPRKRNYIPKKPTQFSLREVLGILEDHTFEGVECDSCPWSKSSPPRWINFCGQRNYINGETLSFSIHPAKRNGISPSSMCRLARLFGAYGEKKAQG